MSNRFCLSVCFFTVLIFLTLPSLQGKAEVWNEPRGSGELEELTVPDRGALYGVVFDEKGLPLPGANVYLDTGRHGVQTDAGGRFIFSGIDPGEHELVVSYLGYGKASRSLILGPQSRYVEIHMEATDLMLDEVVVSEAGNLLPVRGRSLETRLVDRRFIEENPGTTLMQSLAALPGINSMDIGSGISKPVIRGMSHNRVVFAENGIKQEGHQWGSDHGLEVDQYSVERLEIIKGPAALIYGSDAIGGAINIRPPSVPSGNSFRTETLLTGRSNNSLAALSQMAEYSREGRFLRLRFSAQDYADYTVPADSFTYNNWIIPVKNGILANTSGRDVSMTLSAGARGNWGVTSVTASSFRQDAGFFPGSHGLPDASALENYTYSRTPSYPKQKIGHFKLISNTSLFMPGGWLDIDIGYQLNHRRELNKPHVHGAGPLPDHDLELELVLHTVSSGIRYNFNLDGDKRLLAGFDGRWQENTKGGYGFLLPDYHEHGLGAFSVLNWQGRDDMSFEAGIRADWSVVDISAHYEEVWTDSNTISHYRERSPEFDTSFFNFTANAGVSWDAGDDLELRMNIGSSYRTPNAIELSANGIHHGSFRHEMGDTTLNTERAYQLDLGMVVEKERLRLVISPFLSYFSNYLFLRPSGNFSFLPGAGQIYIFSQTRAIHLGGEVYAAYSLTNELELSVTGEFIWAEDLRENFPLPFIPPPAVKSDLSYSPPLLPWPEADLRFSLSVRSVAGQSRVARNEPETAAYTLFNAGFTASLPAGRSNIRLGLFVQNLFDKRYKNHLSFYRRLELPEPGRNVVVTLGIPVEIRE